MLVHISINKCTNVESFYACPPKHRINVEVSSNSLQLVVNLVCFPHKHRISLEEIKSVEVNTVAVFQHKSRSPAGLCLH